jgi:hypothetical protein
MQGEIRKCEGEEGGMGRQVRVLVMAHTERAAQLNVMCEAPSLTRAARQWQHPRSTGGQRGRQGGRES